MAMFFAAFHNFEYNEANGSIFVPHTNSWSPPPWSSHHLIG